MNNKKLDPHSSLDFVKPMADALREDWKKKKERKEASRVSFTVTFDVSPEEEYDRYQF